MGADYTAPGAGLANIAAADGSGIARPLAAREAARLPAAGTGRGRLRRARPMVQGASWSRAARAAGSTAQLAGGSLPPVAAAGIQGRAGRFCGLIRVAQRSWTWNAPLPCDL